MKTALEYIRAKVIELPVGTRLNNYTVTDMLNEDGRFSHADAHTRALESEGLIRRVAPYEVAISPKGALEFERISGPSLERV